MLTVSKVTLIHIVQTSCMTFKCIVGTYYIIFYLTEFKQAIVDNNTSDLEKNT